MTPVNPPSHPNRLRRITVYTRADCSLCDAALFVIRRVQTDMPFALELVDIAESGNERFAEAYGEHIPVVHLDDREIFRHRVAEADLRRFLASGGRWPAG